MGAGVSGVVGRAPGMPAPDRARSLGRGAVAAAVATFVALMAHLLGGGERPALLGVAVPWLVATSVCLVLAQLRWAWLRLTVSVAVSQVLFHLLFSLGSAVGSAAAVPAGHVHGADPLLVPAAGSTGLGMPAGEVHAGGVHAAGHLTGAMGWAHVGAALVTVLALRHGEQVLARLREVSARAVRRLLSALLVPRTVIVRALPTAAPADRVPAPRLRILTTGSVVRRGPPHPIGSLIS